MEGVEWAKQKQKQHKSFICKHDQLYYQKEKGKKEKERRGLTHTNYQIVVWKKHHRSYKADATFSRPVKLKLIFILAKADSDLWGDNFLKSRFRFRI